MTEHFYTIEILNQPISFETVTYLNSVKLSEYSSQKKIQEQRLGYITKEEIYYQILKGNNVNLDRAYIKDFSISEFKKLNNIPTTDKVIIKNISCQSAFFDCDSVTDFSYITFLESINFRESIFSHGTLTFMHSDFSADKIDFSECKFHSHKTTFEHATFKGQNLSFEHANFGGDGLFFVNASFKCDEINFKRANFGNSKVKFQFSEFGTGSKLFERIKVNGPIFDFRRVIFGSGKVDFRRAIFGNGFVTFEESEIIDGKITFRMSKFDGGDLSFRRVDFGADEANFDHIDFGNRSISFEASDVTTLSISNSNIHANIDLRIRKANKIDLSHSYLYSITDLNFHKKESLNKLSLLGVRNLGKIIIKWKDNNVQNLIQNNGGNTDEIADQFNMLKENFSNNGQYNDEDEAYVQFKRNEHSYNRKEALGKSRFLKPFVFVIYALRSLIFDKMGLFATNPNRVLFSMLVVILSYAGLYAISQIIGIGDIINSVSAPDNLGIITRSLYHSAITFFTIGYGDFYPTNFNRVLSAFEGWSGVFLMSYFTVAFVRKILR